MKLNQFGFSLVEAMVGVGLVGGLGLMVMQQQQTSSRMNNQMILTQQANSITRDVQMLLSKKYNCGATFAGMTIVPGPDGVPVPELYKGFPPQTNTHYLKENNDKNGGPIFKADINTAIGKYSLRIKDMRLIEKQGSQFDKATGKLTGSGRAGDFLRLTFGLVNGTPGQRDITRDVLINTKKSGMTITGCYSEIGNDIEEGIAQACHALNAKYIESADGTTRVCQPTNLPQCFLSKEDCNAQVSEPGKGYYALAGTVELAEWDYNKCVTTYGTRRRPLQCRLSGANPADVTKTCNTAWNCVAAGDDRQCKTKNVTCTPFFKPLPLNKCCLVDALAQTTAGSPTGGSPTGGSPTGGSPTGGSPTGGSPTGGDQPQLCNASNATGCQCGWQGWCNPDGGGISESFDTPDTFGRASGGSCDCPQPSMPNRQGYTCFIDVAGRDWLCN